MKKTYIYLLVIIFIFPQFLYSHADGPVAVILSGGGARGAYEIGIWKALIDLDIEIGAVYGVSVGAINGALLAVDDFDTARELWLKLEKDNVMNISEEGKAVLSGEFSFRALLDATGKFIDKGGIDVSPLEGLLRRCIDEEAVRASKTDYGLAAYSLTEIQQKLMYINEIPEGLLVDYIMASANFPLFQRKVIDGEEFIDGGVWKNLIVEMIDSKKFNWAVVIGLDMYMPADIIDMVSGYNSYDLDVILVNPETDLGSVLDFSPENALRLMRIGYLDGLRVFGALPEGHYYIYGKETVRQMFLMLDNEGRKTASELLEIDKLPDIDEFGDEEIFDRLIVSEAEFDYQQVKALLEKYAKIYDISHEELYSEAEFIHMIVDRYIHRNNPVLYYNKYLDFISYLSLETGNASFIYDDFDSRFIAGYEGF